MIVEAPYIKPTAIPSIDYYLIIHWLNFIDGHGSFPSCFIKLDQKVMEKTPFEKNPEQFNVKL